ncbi:MAG: glycoside hydrolase family 3 N-terminal domain-containing protein, partial [Candidatus Gracilibacteria bacterium]|nr:glycoside hydrolase family 3 N-terminal domain-containing protein [Candidatus Gracilibacteria bacterium]
MTQDQKIGQLVCERDRLLAEEPGLKWRYRYPVSLAGLHSFAHRYNASDLKSWMRHYPVGSIFVGTEIIQADSDDTVKMRAGMRKFNEVSRTPLLFCGDFEHGVGAKISGLTRLPDLMALGAANDVKLAREYGAMIAREGLSVGAQWSFSPVVDLNRNMNSWVVNQRAIGDDPARATPLLKALVQGMQAGGMAACAKHFPGDGTDDRNQHMVTSLQMLP